MPSPSKQKGSGWEREISVFLSDLYNESFIRTPSSGAYVGGSNAKRKEFLHEGQIRAFKGDIIPPMDWKYFNSEAKFYKNFPWHQLYAGKCAILDGWIEQQFEAADPGDLNIMFLKFNRQGRFAAVETKFFDELDGMHNYMYYHSAMTNSAWIITNFERFFEFNKDFVKSKSISGTSKND